MKASGKKSASPRSPAPGGPRKRRLQRSPVTERVHLATGLLLPVWKRLPGDHVRVTRLVAEDGQSIIGREVLDIDLATIAETFGLSGVYRPIG